MLLEDPYEESSETGGRRISGGDLRCTSNDKVEPDEDEDWAQEIDHSEFHLHLTSALAGLLVQVTTRRPNDAFRRSLRVRLQRTPEGERHKAAAGEADRDAIASVPGSGTRARAGAADSRAEHKTQYEGRNTTPPQETREHRDADRNRQRGSRRHP